MPPRRFFSLLLSRIPRPILAGFIFLVFQSHAPAAEGPRPSLLFREDWKETPAELPVTQAHVANPNLTLHLHGPSKDLVKKSHHDQPADDPFYLWSGRAHIGNWAVSLESGDGPFDLTGQAKVRWRSKQSGFRILRLIIKPAGGDWMVGDLGSDATQDWRVSEFNVMDIRWRKLNMERITEEHGVIENPDLSRVEQIGFTDLMIGADSLACSRLDWIEVYAVSAPAQ